MFIRLTSILLVFSLLLTGCTSSITDMPEPEIPVTSTILDANGKEISTIFEEHRVEVPIEDVSPHFLNALIASEDHRFFEHRGLNVQAIARAMLRNIRAGRAVEGGSTITQQTAKNLFLSPDRTMTRKIKELFLTIKLERSYTKREILEMYINLAYFGHGGYGVEVAAQTYFGKTAKELTVAESAGLVGLLPGPAYYSPFNNLEAYKERQAIVLNRMVQLEMISEEESTTFKKQEVTLNNDRSRTREASYFVDEVITYISENYEDGREMLYRDGLKVHTTLDLKMQKAAEYALTSALEEFDSELEGALVAIEPKTGKVRSMVGGRDYSRSQRNRAMDNKRPQPASAFKPFLYTAAIANGFTAADTIKCEYVKYNDWEPTNYGRTDYYNRDFTLKEALMKSNNVVAVKLMDEVKPEVVINYAQSMGISSEMNPVLSLALGTSEASPFEMTLAYTSFANRGLKPEPIIIKKIEDKDGHVLEKNTPKLEIVLEEKVAYIVNDMLTGVLEPGGTGAVLKNIFDKQAAGKTGTSNNYRDAWFVGYTTDLVTGVYVGYDEPKSINQTGGSLAGPIWANFMNQAHIDKEPQKISRPSGIINRNICMETGKLATITCPNILEASFISGTEPTEECSLHQETKEDTSSEDLDYDEEKRPQNFFDWFFNWN